MFDIGWTELLVLGAIALIVVGPKDLPGMLRRLGQLAGQARRMARDFQRTMEDAADQADLKKDLRDVQGSMSDWNSKIGANNPRKYAESFLKGEDDDKPSAPAPGSHDAADAAENAAWQAEQARKAGDAPSAAPSGEAAPSGGRDAGSGAGADGAPPASRSA